MLTAAIASVVLATLTVLIHYEALRVISHHVRRLPIAPRPRLIVLMLALFVAHTVEVWAFALGYYVLDTFLGLGFLAGAGTFTGIDHLYFSAVTYTSLGLGDVYPLGALRLVAGVEALIGLVMIGWSGSFTYLAMEEFWTLDGARRRRR